MVVQDEDDAPIEAPLTKKTKKYVVVKNHVRELLSDNESSVSVTSDSNVVEKSNTVKKHLKRKERSETSASVSQPTNISESDLEELKTVYNKCKAVLQKIESKYGHLLNLNDNESVDRCENTTSEKPSDSCSCSLKKKIIFDENDQQVEKDCLLDNHICVKRVKRSYSDSQPPKPSLRIEYDTVPDLPNTLQELGDILKDQNIDKSYRQMVINKIYLMKQEYLNEIRYNRRVIVKKVKENPEEVLDFRGTNLYSLHGYPTKPVKESEERSQ